MPISVEDFEFIAACEDDGSSSCTPIAIIKHAVTRTVITALLQTTCRLQRPKTAAQVISVEHTQELDCTLSHARTFRIIKTARRIVPTL
jgi:hypothetical protein